MALKDMFKLNPSKTPVQVYSGNGVYTLYKDRTVRKQLGDNPGRYSVDEITIELEDGSDLQERVTLGRVVMVGVFAPLIKKKSGGEKWMLIEGEDFSWLEEVPRKKQQDAVRFVQAVKKAQREGAQS